ncbi:MAG: hypothetical protein ACLT49_10260, partial [Sutterella wadsworthensis]
MRADAGPSGHHTRSAAQRFIYAPSRHHRLFTQRWWVGKKSYVTVSGKAGGRSSVKGPGPLLSSVIVATVAVVIAFILYLYAIILTGSLVKVWGVNNEITLENYSYVFTHGSKAIKDTLLIACIGTPLGGLLAVLVG